LFLKFLNTVVYFRIVTWPPWHRLCFLLRSCSVGESREALRLLSRLLLMLSDGKGTKKNPQIVVFIQKKMQKSGIIN
jgi:hypothetical protein